ncbi:FAD-dependent oxidoreductase [filamentous cyanobacterium CCP5]|nr:FAD-dependent oxidoreductase [filamentous cyanobacterium CCP5]
MSEQHGSFWIASTLESNYPAVTDPLTVDVAIIGGGMVGITAAYLLKQAGRRVAVLEADRVATGVSGHTTAKVTSLHQLIYAELIKHRGVETARIYGDSNQAAIARLEKMIESEQIDCDFEHKDAYSFATSADQLDKIKAEVEAAQKLGLPATFVETTDLPFAVAGAVKFSQQAQFHPCKYLLALASKVDGGGSFIFEQTRVKTVSGENPCQVITDNGPTVTAQDVIVATNLPILDQGLFFAKTYPKRSYLIGAKIDPATAFDGMYIGTGSSYHSLRTTPTDDGGTLLIIGGGSHKVGEITQTQERYQQLRDYARLKFGLNAIDYYWSTQDMVSFDRLPYIGKLTPADRHIYVATGFSLWGMSKSVLSAMVLSDLIQGIQNPWAELYDATRPTPFITSESLKQNFDVGTRWVGDRLKGLFDSSDSVAPGEGKVVTTQGEQRGIYRDEAGQLHQVAAVCPHLGCVVAWNQAEKSWDCPCHGSRFDTQGRILQGPAVKPLDQR